MKFTRVTVNPNQMGGAPCIRGLRIPVALQFAAEAVRERAIPLTAPGVG